MGYESAWAAVEAHFNTQWDDETPVQYLNAPFTAPVNGGEYVKFSILSGPSDEIGYAGGSNIRYRYFGLVQIDIHIPEGTGTDRAEELQDIATAIFQGQRISGVVFRSPEIFDGAPPPTGYFRRVLTVPFERDETA